MISIQERFMIKSQLWWRAYSIYFADKNLNLQWVEIFSENPSSQWVEIFSENPSAQWVEIMGNLDSQWVEIFSGAIHIQNGLKKCLEA